jgi:hypothetical protein
MAPSGVLGNGKWGSACLAGGRTMSSLFMLRSPKVRGSLEHGRIFWRCLLTKRQDYGRLSIQIYGL